MQALIDRFRQHEGQCWIGQNNGIRAASFWTRIMAWKNVSMGVNENYVSYHISRIGMRLEYDN
jgi:hypothetical protein